VFSVVVFYTTFDLHASFRSKKAKRTKGATLPKRTQQITKILILTDYELSHSLDPAHRPLTFYSRQCDCEFDFLEMNDFHIFMQFINLTQIETRYMT